MAKNACSKGSSIAAAVSRICRKHSSTSCGISRGWYGVPPMATPMDRRRPQADGSASSQQRVQVQDGVPVETDVPGFLDQQVDRGLVVQDHLRFTRVLAPARLSEFQQALGSQQRVGVAFEAAGVPGEIDQQPVTDRSRIGPGGTLATGGTAHFEQSPASVEGKVEGLVRPVAVEERPVVSDGSPVLDGRTHRPPDRLAFGGDGNIVFANPCIPSAVRACSLTADVLAEGLGGTPGGGGGRRACPSAIRVRSLTADVSAEGLGGAPGGGGGRRACPSAIRVPAEDRAASPSFRGTR